MRFLIGAFLAASLLACESSELTGPTGGNSKKDSSDSSGDDSADEPVMVGGAHLTCVDLTESQLTESDSKEIGCALNETATGRKIDLSPYITDWSIQDEVGSPVSVETKDGTKEQPFHKQYTYRDQSYLQHSLMVRVTSQDGRTKEYSRQLAVLDAGFNFDSNVHKPNLTAAFLSQENVQIPFGCSGMGLTSFGRNSDDNDDEDDQCDMGSTVTSTFADALFNVPCYGGRLSDTYTISRPGEKDVPVQLGQDACIVHQEGVIATQPANYGCYKVPLAGPKGQFYIAIIEGVKVTPSAMAQLIQKYACKGK